jgi:type I restriction enzyme M protein
LANGIAPLGFESKLWAAADALRNNMDAAEYKHVVLGLIFLKYISDVFEAKHAELESQKAQGADPEDPDEYRAASIFWVPEKARWSHLKDNAPQPTIGTIVDDAMTEIERGNSSLKGVLPKDYARPGLDKQRLGQLINLVSDIGLGSPADRAKDVLDRVYEYFLAQFASAGVRRAANSTRRRTSSAFWLKCWHRTRVASMTRVAERTILEIAERKIVFRPVHPSMS